MGKADAQDQLAFVGLGEMGKRMAANLAKSLAQSGQVGFYLPFLSFLLSLSSSAWRNGDLRRLEIIGCAQGCLNGLI